MLLHLHILLLHLHVLLLHLHVLLLHQQLLLLLQVLLLQDVDWVRPGPGLAEPLLLLFSVGVAGEGGHLPSQLLGLQLLLPQALQLIHLNNIKMYLLFTISAQFASQINYDAENYFLRVLPLFNCRHLAFITSSNPIISYD